MPFTSDTFDFLRDLEQNNEKTWFEDNRARYENALKTPALDLIAALSEPMSALSPALRAEPRLNGSLRRINRDARFSKDKTPYSPRLHLVFWHGDHPNRSPGMHFVLHADGVGYGAGQWAIEPDRLAALRNKVIDPSTGAAFEAALSSAEAVGCQLGEPALKRIPKGFDADAPRADYLRYKGFVARTHDEKASPKAVIGEQALEWMMTQTRACLPLLAWLTD